MENKNNNNNETCVKETLLNILEQVKKWEAAGEINLKEDGYFLSFGYEEAPDFVFQFAIVPYDENDCIFEKLEANITLN